MTRIINTNSPGKRRNAHMRTIAEILRLISQHREINQQTRDLVAMLVYSLRGVTETVEESILAWEKRGYWKKADDFQQKWWWSTLMADEIEKLLRDGNWDKLPDTMIKLYPHFADIQVNKMTRDPTKWNGAYHRLIGSGSA